jgi:hypothetical protein
MANAAQTPDAPASAGQLLWSQPNICDNILSHLPRDDQVALMTVNNNTFQYVIRWRYDWIYGEVLAHLDYVRTPEVSVMAFWRRIIARQQGYGVFGETIVIYIAANAWLMIGAAVAIPVAYDPHRLGGLAQFSSPAGPRVV